MKRRRRLKPTATFTHRTPLKARSAGSRAWAEHSMLRRRLKPTATFTHRTPLEARSAGSRAWAEHSMRRRRLKPTATFTARTPLKARSAGSRVSGVVPLGGTLDATPLSSCAGEMTAPIPSAMVPRRVSSARSPWGQRVPLNREVVQQGVRRILVTLAARTDEQPSVGPNFVLRSRGSLGVAHFRLVQPDPHVGPSLNPEAVPDPGNPDGFAESLQTFSRRPRRR